MLTRSAVVATLASIVAGCANDAPNLAGFTSTSALAIASPASLSAVPASDVHQAYRKTMTDRVLAAIALERVTGLKPDPARLGE